jgi:pimeloyl-ACP methyl ester carboxylesterase
MSGVWRWTKRIGLGLVGLIVFALIVSTVWEQNQRAYAHSHFKPSGKLVAIGDGRKMHIDCRGQGSPTVLFESGLDTNGALAWSAVHDQVASFTRACAYDRAGIMWSDPKKTTYDGEGVAHDLHALLNAAGEKGPFVMVGHSLGGPYIMNFTRLYPSYVAGVVFVDASHPDQNKRMAAAGVPGGDGKLPLPYRILARMGWSGLPRILTYALQANADSGPKMPPAAQAAANAYIGQSVRAAIAGEGENINLTLAEAGKLRTLGDRPLVVLTATEPPPAKMLAAAGLTPAEYAKIQVLWKGLQTDEASWSTHSRRQEVPDSTHYIQFGRPDIVIAATKEVVDAVRAGPAKGAMKTAVKPK